MIVIKACPYLALKLAASDGHLLSHACATIYRSSIIQRSPPQLSATPASASNIPTLRQDGKDGQEIPITWHLWIATAVSLIAALANRLIGGVEMARRNASSELALKMTMVTKRSGDDKQVFCRQ